MSEKDKMEDIVSTEGNQEQQNTQEFVKALQTEIESLKDRLLRNAAEFENARKRAEKQVEEAREYAVSSFAKDLIGITDNLDRALQYQPQNPSDELKNVIQGTQMIYTELKNIFKKHHIQELSTAIGDKFDYNLHQAIAQIPTNDYPKGSIIDIMQIGYKLKDRLLRPAVVAISDGNQETLPKNEDEN